MEKKEPQQPRKEKKQQPKKAEKIEKAEKKVEKKAEKPAPKAEKPQVKEETAATGEEVSDEKADAIRAFQADHGLKTYGVANITTQKAIDFAIDEAIDNDPATWTVIDE